MLTKTRTLTVGELRAMLENELDDTPVLIQAPSGDAWGTKLALPIRDAEEMLVEWSHYHDTYSVPEQDDDDDREWALVLGVNGGAA